MEMNKIGSIGSRNKFPTNHAGFPLRGTQAITKPIPMNVSVIPIRSCHNSDICALSTVRFSVLQPNKSAQLFDRFSGVLRLLGG